MISTIPALKLQLPHSNIMVYTKEDYEINFLMANKKMDVIINCLDGEYFYACLRLIALSGKVFQLAKTDMKKKLKMGTYNRPFYTTSNIV